MKPPSQYVLWAEQGFEGRMSDMHMQLEPPRWEYANHPVKVLKLRHMLLHRRITIACKGLDDK